MNSKEFLEEYHDIYDLVTLGDENVIRDTPHFPEEDIVIVASDAAEK
jgi:hypothetical protein